MTSRQPTRPSAVLLHGVDRKARPVRPLRRNQSRPGGRGRTGRGSALASWTPLPGRSRRLRRTADRAASGPRHRQAGRPGLAGATRSRPQAAVSTSGAGRRAGSPGRPRCGDRSHPGDAAPWAAGRLRGRRGRRSPPAAPHRLTRRGRVPGPGPHTARCRPRPGVIGHSAGERCQGCRSKYSSRFGICSRIAVRVAASSRSERRRTAYHGRTLSAKSSRSGWSRA